MEEIEDLVRRQRGIAAPPMNVEEVMRLILTSVQDAGSNPLAFSTIDGGIAELGQRYKQFRDLPAAAQREMYITAVEELSRRDTTFKGGQPVSLFGKMMLGALGIIGKVGDVATNPSKIVGVADEFLGPALRRQPNAPPPYSGSGSALVGGGLEGLLPKVVEQIDTLRERVSKLEGTPAPEGVPLPN